MIDESLQRVAEGRQMIEQIGKSLKLAAQYGDEAERLVSDVADASKEQADTIKMLNNSIGQISGVVQENAATAEQSVASIQEVTAQTIALNEIVGRYKIR